MYSRFEIVDSLGLGRLGLDVRGYCVGLIWGALWSVRVRVKGGRGCWRGWYVKEFGFYKGEKRRRLVEWASAGVSRGAVSAVEILTEEQFTNGGVNWPGSFCWRRFWILLEFGADESAVVLPSVFVTLIYRWYLCLHGKDLLHLYKYLSEASKAAVFWHVFGY